MRKQELLKRIEKLENDVFVLHQKVSNIENRQITLIRAFPFPRENRTNTDSTFTCSGDASTSSYTV